MQRSIASVLAVLSLLAQALPADASREPRPADVAALTHLACEAGHAYARRDLQALEGVTAEDYLQTDVRGGVLRRADWLEFVRNRKSELTLECDDVQVRFYGAAAVVTGGWTYTRSFAGTDVVTHSRWTSVWTRTSSGWKRHVFQNTYVNAAADDCAANADP